MSFMTFGKAAENHHAGFNIDAENFCSTDIDSARTLSSKAQHDFEKIKTVGFLGLGKSNLGAMEYLKHHYRHLKMRVRDERAQNLPKLCGVEYFLGAEALSKIDEEVLFLSPSVRRDRRELEEARRRGVLLFSDCELFFSRFRGEAIGITGSDGKSTTTRLISEILCASGVESLPCGNYGVSLSPLIDKLFMPAVELSSFQLSYISPRLSRAVITNITENHLDWHRDFEEYKSAKLAITENAYKLIYDGDCEIAAELLRGRHAFCITSLNLPYEKLREKLPAENYISCHGCRIFLNGELYFSLPEDNRHPEYIKRDMLLSAAATIKIATGSTLEKLFRNFRGLSHRCEKILTHRGITYINSSIDTTPERVIRTLSGIKSPTVLILGGKSKGLSYENLLSAMRSFTCGAVLLGEVGREIYEAAVLDGNFDFYPMEFADDFTEAIEKGNKMLTRGGVILLSPAATSYDKYKSFEERGGDFTAAVRKYTKNK